MTPPNFTSLGFGFGAPQYVLTTTEGYVISRSLRFNSADNAYLSRTPASAGNRKTWTWAGWVKRSAPSGLSNQSLFSCNVSNDNAGTFHIYFDSDDALYATNWFTNFRATNQVFRDFSSWYHIVVSVDTTDTTANDRIKIYVNGVRVTSFASEINPTLNEDLAVNQAGIHYINRISTSYSNGYQADVHFIDGQALDQYSFGEFDDNGVWQPIEFVASGPNDGTIWSDSLSNEYTLYNQAASPVVGDGSFGFDGSLFNLVTDWNGVYNQNYSYRLEFIPPTPIPFTQQVRVYTRAAGNSPYSNNFYVDTGSGYGSAIPHVQDSWVTVASGSGSLHKLKSTAVQNGTSWAAIEIDGVVLINGDTANIGTNGFHLPFSDNSTAAALGTDTSGNGNTWTVNNISVTAGAGNDSLFDSPQNGTQTDTGAGGEVSGNYATLNPLNTLGSSPSLANGNLQITSTASYDTLSTIGVSSGKWYCELTVTAKNALGIAGIIDIQNTRPSAYSLSGQTYVTYRSTGTVEGNQTGGTGFSWAQGDTLGFALDLDSGTQTLKVYKNGSLESTSNITASGVTWAMNYFYSEGTSDYTVNFGQRAFAYSAPSGFKALCTANLDDPTIADGSDYMDVVLYTGNGTSQTISGLEFSPDFAWIKGKSVASGHGLFDTVRGATKRLLSHTTSLELTNSQYLNSFTSDGFGIGNHSSINTLDETYVGWTWDAGHPSTPATGAVSFDGTGDHLVLPASADFNFGSGDFTIEFFWYPTSTDRQGLYHGSFGADYSIGIDYNGFDNNKKLGFWASSNGTSWDIANADGSGNGITTGEPTQNAWNHIAFVRDGNTLVMYLNGSNVGSVTSSDTIDLADTDTPAIGAWWNSDTAMSDVHGYISNFRIVKGTALYTSSFTPPTAELTNVTNTKLLCCQSTTSATTAAVSPGTITANGNAAATTYNPLDAFSVNGTGYSTASAAGITQGTIPLTGASVNQSAGFSIVSYTGNDGSSGTVGHGLGSKPSMFIVKNRDTSGDDWIVYHEALGATKRIKLNSTETATTSSSQFNDTEPTSSLFTVGSLQNINDSYAYVAYCFAPVEGYSAFGSYTGNGNADGPFVFTNFRPRWIMTKASSAGGNWQIIDTTRDVYNLANSKLWPSQSYEENSSTLGGASADNLDVLSNGFKLRTTNAGTNGSNVTYIYAAFAENPFRTARAR